MTQITFETPLTSIKGISAYFLARLKKLNITTAGELLHHFPYRYEDFSHTTPIAELIVGNSYTVRAVVEKVAVRKVWKKRMTITEAHIADESGKLKIVWFNQSYVGKSIVPGKHFNFSGKLLEKSGSKYFSNPLYEIASDIKETRHTGRLVPIYPQTRGLTSKGIRFILQPILENIHAEDALPHVIQETEKLVPLTHALQDIHFPASEEDAKTARRRFAFEDLFLLSLRISEERAKTKKTKAEALPITVPEIKELLPFVPFALTPSQKKSLWEIVEDLNKDFPMNRLLQGDVGSGKTIVVALAAALVAQKERQAVFLAPTEILARQHYLGLIKLFGETNIPIALLTSNEAKVFYGNDLEADMKKEDLKREIKNGKIKIVVGTHALFGKGIDFKALRLVIVDEQHRFGVHQRAHLLLKKEKSVQPHFLSMSATPIPRTLALTIFGDLDMSLITELPKNRKPIITKFVQKENRDEAYKKIRAEIKNGRQAFVVCPRIEPNPEEVLTHEEIERAEIKTVTEEFEKLSKTIFPDLHVAMLHGKMKSIEKEKVMSTFAEGKTNILISTSVIEVGVDVPNATIMMIENADRFGVAQLYQFRGRVGRGAHQSYCFLFSETETIKANKRLAFIEQAKNGFELAEYDLKTRGPGEFFGTEQSGLPDLAMKAIQNPDIVLKTKKYTEEILKDDPTLSKYPILKKRLEVFAKLIHRE